MRAKYRIKRRRRQHPVQQEWAKDRNIKEGTLMPAPCPVADKPGGKKGKPVIYNDAKLRDMYVLNGGSKKATDKQIASDSRFRFMTRIGGWLFNTAANRHLVGLLKGLLPKWLGKIADSYVPFPLKGKKAKAEKIYCDGNDVIVDRIKGKWAHLAPGVAFLTQVVIGTDDMYDSRNVRWRVPAGWIELDMLEKA